MNTKKESLDVVTRFRPKPVGVGAFAASDNAENALKVETRDLQIATARRLTANMIDHDAMVTVAGTVKFEFNPATLESPADSEVEVISGSIRGLCPICGQTLPAAFIRHHEAAIEAALIEELMRQL